MNKVAIVLYGASRNWTLPDKKVNPYSGKNDLFSKLAYELTECKEFEDIEKAHIEGDRILKQIILFHGDKLSRIEKKHLVHIYNQIPKWYA